MTSLAGVCAVPQDHVGVNPPLLLATDTTTATGSRFHEPARITASESVGVTISKTPTEWTKTQEKELRRLALKEATRDITREEMNRLNWLSSARNHYSNPLSTEEILLQIRRDRILEKMAEALRDYVEFAESTDNKGTTT
jgi:hypothetical protein